MKPAMIVLAAALPAILLGGCQGMPGFEGLYQPAALPPPAPPPAPPPEERGIWIVGSPAGEESIRAASARFGGTPDTRPRLVADGTGPGFRRFCNGVGLEHPDMVVADRAIRPDELRRCTAKGITMTEYELGPKQRVYVKDSHMATIPGVRDFVESWTVPGKPLRNPAQAS